MHWWSVSYVLANWSLILCVLAIIAALVAIGIFARNWKAFAAVGIILAAGFAYQWIDKQGYQRAQAEETQRVVDAKNAQIEALELRIETVNAANEMIAMQAVTDTNELSELRAKANETPADATVALKRDAVRRVRDFRRSATGAAPAKDGAAARAGGHSSVLPIGKWRRSLAGS